jgi:hypothetical protein
LLTAFHKEVSSVRLQNDLLKHLEQHGWEVTRQIGERDLLAWFHEIWTLESRWSPHGFTLFLTFLIDPQPGNPNPFWAIGTSFKIPENSAEAFGEPSLMMTPHWVNELPQFVAGLNAIRQSSAKKNYGDQEAPERNSWEGKTGRDSNEG